jgi:DNA polymerase-1
VDKFHSPQGIPVNAVYGLASMMINLLTEYKPTHVAVCFDEGRDTFRKKLFPQYKANRSASPDEFRVQVSLIRNLVDALGIQSFSDATYEADDLIATIATNASESGQEVLIITSDRDSFQLINDQINVLYPKKGLSEVAKMTPAAIVEKYGLTPKQYLDFAALRGDSSDNLPGIPGVGEKTAASWIQKFGSLSELISAQDELTGKVGESFRANVETAQTNFNLTKLVTDVAIDTDPARLTWSGGQARDAIALFGDLGFKSLIPRLRTLVGEVDTADTKSTIAVGDHPVVYISENVLVLSAANTIQEFPVSYCDELDQMLKTASANNPVLTNDLKAIAKLYLRAGKEFSIERITQVLDVLILEYLNNPGTRIQLDDLVENSQVDQLFADNSLLQEFVTAIANSYNRVSSASHFKEVLKLYDLVEGRVALVLAEMEHFGIAVNVSGLQQMIERKSTEQRNLELAGYKEHGREFNFGSPKQLQEVLFDERKLTKTRKTKTGFTTDADALDFLMVKHPEDKLLQLLREWRETSKIRQMLVSLQESIINGRIHTTFAQTIAATGRLSSTKPNLQNVPVRTESGRAIRELFVTEPPYEYLITADYSQIELRIMAHLAKDKALIEAFASGEDLHISVASQIYGIPSNEVTPELRNQIKAVSYGLAYGLSSYGLSQSLRIDVSEADLLMSKFFERFSGVRDFLKQVVIEARELGYTETLLGRRRYLPDLSHDNRFRREVAERAALNAPIQGTAADIIKLAMVKVSEQLSQSGLEARLLLQVHDELVLEVTKKDLDQVVELTKKAMTQVMKLSVPLEVSVGYGKNWLTAAH